MVEIVELGNQEIWVRFDGRTQQTLGEVQQVLTDALCPNGIAQLSVTLEFNSAAYVRATTSGLEVSTSGIEWFALCGDFRNVCPIAVGFVMGACLALDDNRQVHGILKAMQAEYHFQP